MAPGHMCFLALGVRVSGWVCIVRLSKVGSVGLRYVCIGGYTGVGGGYTWVLEGTRLRV